jgi:outer membrane lipoprotein-sorting protein
MSNFLRRLPLSRLLLLCGVLVGVGIGATALATALGIGPTPPPKPLAQAVHDALMAPAPAGVSARIQLTNHLLEGANLADTGAGASAGGGLASSPLVTGGSGRLWISNDGRVRIELQAENGDTEILYDGHTLSLYDAASSTLYRYTPPPPSEAQSSYTPGSHKVPTVAQIEEAIARVAPHATLSGATPTDVAGQPAYTVRVSPNHNGGLIAGAELSFDAVHGVPLRAAVYATSSPAPVIELAATEVSYEAVPNSVFAISPPPGTKIEEIVPPRGEGSTPARDGSRPHVTTHGSGLEAITELESPAKEEAGGKSSAPASSTPALPEGLQKVQINGTTATELPTALGTLLSFERAGVRYLLVGSDTPQKIEEFAQGL